MSQNPPFPSFHSAFKQAFDVLIDLDALVNIYL